MPVQQVQARSVTASENVSMILVDEAQEPSQYVTLTGITVSQSST